MKKILIATTNKHKFDEIKQMLTNFPFEFISLRDFNDFDEVVEDGLTFQDNALIKARYYYQKYNMPVLADDSGISIAYLNDLPNIKSARFLKHMSYPQKNQFIVDLMRNVSNRKSHYSCVLAYIDGQEYCFEGILNGKIADHVGGENGFGYDPIFIPEHFTQSIGELNEQIKAEISHRRKAIDLLVKHFEEN